MKFSKIILTGYKNYIYRQFDFSQRIIGICGLNGKGKTNLLDAIYYLCFTKSYFSRADQGNIHFEKEGFRVEGLLEHEGDQKSVISIYRPPARKEFSMADINYEKFSEHIGRVPCVMIAPDDIALVTGGNEMRRKYLDALMSQLDPKYLEHLIRYNRLLAQRNSFLKNAAKGNNPPDHDLLATLNEQMIPAGNYIHTRRNEFTKGLFQQIGQFYRRITDGRESITSYYQSQLNDTDFSLLLKRSEKRDFLLQRSNTGIHRDDIIFSLQDNPFKLIASQGQRKSLLFACKLAEFEVLKNEKGFAPILLLDDVFEKLDERRMHHLLDFICAENNGQTFITDTHCERLEDTLKALTSDYQIVELI